MWVEEIDLSDGVSHVTRSACPAQFGASTLFLVIERSCSIGERKVAIAHMRRATGQDTGHLFPCDVRAARTGTPPAQ
jgi:hypothetical protein